MGESRLQHHHELPLAMLRSSASTAHDSGLLALELTALAESCIPAIAEGRLTEVHDLRSTCSRGRDALGAGHPTSPAVAYLGWLDYWQGNLREARAQLERSLSMLLPFDWGLRGLRPQLPRQDLPLPRRPPRRAKQHGRDRHPDRCGRDTPAGPPCSPDSRGCSVGGGKSNQAVALALAPGSGPEYRLAAAHRAKVLLRAGLPTEALAQLESRTSSDAFVYVECLSRCLEAEALAVRQGGRAPGARAGSRSSRARWPLWPVSLRGQRTH